MLEAKQCYNKVVKIIRSCETADQLQMCYLIASRFCLMYGKEAHLYRALIKVLETHCNQLTQRLTQYSEK